MDKKIEVKDSMKRNQQLEVELKLDGIEYWFKENARENQFTCSVNQADIPHPKCEGDLVYLIARGTPGMKPVYITACKQHVETAVAWGWNIYEGRKK